MTEFVPLTKEKKLPFFLSFCYCVSRAANAVPEFRQRILGDGIIEFDICKTSHTSVLCNHALVDGLHMSQFYENLNGQIQSLLQIVA